MKEQVRDIYCFGPYRLDLSIRALFREGSLVAMPSKAFDLLRIFVQNPGKVVKKEELLREVWHGNAVYNNVDRQVSNLRQILGKTSDELNYIKTVHGEGYAFAAPVRIKLDPPVDQDLVHEPKSVEMAARLLAEPDSGRERRFSSWHYRSVLVAVVLALILGSSSAFYLTKRRKTHASIPYKVGVSMLLAGNLPIANTLLEKAVASEPNRGATHAAWSTALGLLGYETRAKNEAKRAWDLVQGSSREESLQVKAQYYVSTLDWQNASRTYETLSALFPDDVWYGTRYALALAQMGRLSDAFDVIGKLKSRENPSTRELQIDLTEAAVAEMANDYERELAAASLGEGKARAQGNSYQLSRALLQQGWALDNLGRLKEAGAKDKSAQSLFEELKDVGGEAQAWKNIGDVYADIDRLEAAQSAYRTAISKYQQINWRSGEAVALNNLGYVMRDLGDLPGARDLFEQSLSISRSMSDLRRQGMALNGVAVVLKRSGNLSGAAEAYLAALEIDRRMSDDGKIATVLNNLAIVFQDEGKLDEAKTHFDQAIEIFGRIGRPMDVAMVFGNLGDLAIRMGQLSIAEANYKLQIETARKIAQAKQLGYGLFGLGETYFLRADMAHAKEYLQLSLDQRLEAHDAGLVAETKLAQSEVALAENDFKSAEVNAKDAAAEFHKDRESDEELLALSTLAEALIKDQKAQEAIEVSRVVQRLLASSEDKDSKMGAGLHLWKVSWATGSPQAAVKTLESVLADAEECRYLPHSLEARAAIAQIRLKSGDRSAQRELAAVRRLALNRSLYLIAKKASVPRLSIASADFRN